MKQINIIAAWIHYEVERSGAVLQWGRRRVLFVFKLFLWFLPVVVLMNSPPSGAAQTIVSLTFDDGLNQSLVLDMLLAHNMKATFYVNSNLIGSGGGYLTKAELDALFTYGNEIGGHTINHVDLATLSDAQQQAAICDDMQTLNNWYPGQIHSFAYPYASIGPDTQSILAAGCPGVGTYTSARTVGGLVSGTQCTACPTAESIPPGNPYYILTPESILSTTTLDEIETLVTQAENNGGGWVPLVFHNVCDGCDPYSVTPATLDAFLTWLQPRTANNTYVRTVNQVMTGDLPSSPPPSPDTTAPTVSIFSPVAGTVSGTITVSANAADNVGVVGVQFQLDGANMGNEVRSSPYSLSWNTTTATNGAHSLTAVARDAAGNATTSAAVAVTVSNADSTAPTVSLTSPVAGVVSGTITVSANAADNVGVVGVQFKLDGTNLGSEDTSLPYSLSWNTTTSANGNHTLTAVARDAAGNTTTSAAVVVTVNNADTTAPTVSLIAPPAGTVSGTVTVSANATDNVGVVGVQFKLDGANLGSEVTSAPYSLSWNTTTATNGTHTLTAVARDAAGNATTSGPITVSVNNTLTGGSSVSSSGSSGGGGSIGLIELAFMLIAVFVTTARNKSISK